MPVRLVWALVMFGLRAVEVNPFGPAQLYVSDEPPVMVDDKLSVVPTQRGLLLVAAIVIPFRTDTEVVTEAEHPPAKTAVTLYRPFMAVVAPAWEGVCEVELNPAGPAHAKLNAPAAVAVRLMV